jgi:hypothetical protein
MASGFVAREFGLGLGLQLMLAICNENNESYRGNKPYVLTGDAELLKGLPVKSKFL